MLQQYQNSFVGTISNELNKQRNDGNKINTFVNILFKYGY